MEDTIEQPKADPEGSESPTAMPEVPSHQEDLDDALEKAKDSTDDSLVENAGKKDGLRGAMAARMDSWNRRLNHVRKGRLQPSGSPLLIPMDALAIQLKGVVLNPSLLVAEKSIGFLRDRLRPKAPKAAEAPPVAK